MPSSTDTLIDLMLSMHRIVRERSRSAARVHPLALLGFRILHIIAESSDPVTMRDVAEKLGITPPSATALVGRLVKKGYIKRRRDPADRRRILLVMTPAGRQALQRGKRAMTAGMRDLFKNVSEPERQTLIKIFKKMAEREKAGA